MPQKRIKKKKFLETQNKVLKNLIKTNLSNIKLQLEKNQKTEDGINPPKKDILPPSEQKTGSSYKLIIYAIISIIILAIGDGLFKYNSSKDKKINSIK